MPNRKTQPFAFLLILLSTLSSLSQTSANPAFPPIPIDATEEQVHQAVALVRAGLNLAPKTWPEGARVAVCLSFDVDNELLWRWMHENLASVEDGAKEQQLLTQSIDYLTRATGKRPVGFRAPAWEFSLYTLDQIRRAGFLYDSSFMAMDDPYELVSNGQKTGLIELPINWIADDYPYYEPDSSGSLPDPQLVFDVYKGEFDAAYEERSLFILTLHPHISGHRSRIQALDRLIDYMKSKPGVCFATLEQVANYVKAQQGKSLVNKISD